MEKDLLLKRLLTQASVSVLAGLLMSSAAMAEDMGEPVGELESISIGAYEGVFDFEGEPVGEPASISIGITDDGSVDDDGAFDLDLNPPAEGTEPGGEDASGGEDSGQPGEVAVDPDTEDGDVSGEGMCDGCSSKPYDLSDNDVMGTEFDVTALQRGEDTGGVDGPAGGRDISRGATSDKGRGAGRDGDLGFYRRPIVN